MLPGIRLTNLLIFLFCAAALLVALYLEHYMYMDPCPLCMTQRIFVIAVGVIALLAFLHNPAQRGRRIYAGLGILLALGGAYFSSRQLWLQSLPADQVPACGPSVSYMFEVLPFADTLKAMVHGDGNCAEVDLVLGVNLVVLTLLAFLALLLANVYQLWRRR